ncbi:hypothetical protein QVD17_03178 [Tagetes erecta]|uniref:G domain-containing protein n=1 Tax=Tagetes erecta TaxID=13708 RepID=A0AAD8P9R0_TARER|nr:hypothetical protein QVD17_03178 [Tagetes erecta]
MGGDTVSVLSSTVNNDDDDRSTVTPDSPDHFNEMFTLWPGGLSGDTAGVNESEANEKRMRSVYAQVIKSYDDVKDRVENMEIAKNKVLRYTPGSWVENIGGMTKSDYNVPKTTTLLLIGPKGSGKSSLVNQISRVFEDDKFAPERAQVAYNSSIRDGTCLLQEYMIPRNSTSFCLYDTPGFHNDLSVNLEMIIRCMTKGVRNGELVNRTKCKTCQDKLSTYERRRVDYVIFVVNGLSVLKCLESNGADTQYMDMVTKVFSSSFLSFKDHKPVIAITHGDLLSISERARVRVGLGNLLGVHPLKQTFDIPDNCEPRTELAIVDLVRYALEHADRNLPCKSQPTFSKGSTILQWAHLLLLLAVGIFMFTVYLHGCHSLKLNPESVHEPNLEIKKVMEFNHQSVHKPDMVLKNVTEENDPSIVHVPSREMEKHTEFDQENVTESDLEMKKVTELDESELDVKKNTECDEPDLIIKEVIEVLSASTFFVFLCGIGITIGIAFFISWVYVQEQVGL